MNLHTVGKVFAFAAAAGAAWQLMRRAHGGTRLDGRVALVTGGSRGLGFAIAEQLLANGADVALCARDEQEVVAAVRQLAERCGRSQVVYGAVCDVGDEHSVEQMVARVARRLGPIDVLVNNAGVMTVGPLPHMTRADFDEAMRVHYQGALNTCLAVLPSMRARRSGHIVNVASIGGLVPVPHMAPYVASKFALVGLSRALREDLARDGVRVTTVCPGPMRTGSALNARFKGRHDEEFRWFGASAALPVVSTDGRRAARQVVAAVRRGDAELMVGAPARVLGAIGSLLPGPTGALLAAIERLLPAPRGTGGPSRSGADSSERLDDTWLLRRTEAAADALQPGD